MKIFQAAQKQNSSARKVLTSDFEREDQQEFSESAAWNGLASENSDGRFPLPSDLRPGVYPYYLNNHSAQRITQYPPNPLFHHPIQAKMMLGGANDKYEQEADRVAKQVINQLHSPVTQTSTPDQPIQREVTSEDDLHRKPEITPIQRQLALPADEADASAPAELETSINRARSSGQALPDNLQDAMGQALNANLSGVRVHTDAQAHRLNHALQSRAFTNGNNIFFRQGEFDPNSRSGQELLAHEVIHVVQQQVIEAPAMQTRVQCMKLKGKRLELETDDITKNEIPEDVRINLEAAKEILAKAGEGLLWNPETQVWEKGALDGSGGQKAAEEGPSET